MNQKGDLFLIITEDPLEQLTIQWFYGTGWNYVHNVANHELQISRT